MRFTSAFYRQNLAFPKICTFAFTLHRCKPTMNLFFLRRSMWPIDQIKDWFQLRTPISLHCRRFLWTRHKIKDGGYNNTNINKQLSPVQDTPALQAKHPSDFRRFLGPRQRSSGPFPNQRLVIEPRIETEITVLQLALKCAFKLIFHRCIFEFMINTAPPTSNSVHGREKCFKYNKFRATIFSGCVAQWSRMYASLKGDSEGESPLGSELESRRNRTLKHCTLFFFLVFLSFFFPLVCFPLFSLLIPKGTGWRLSAGSFVKMLF